MNHRATHRDTPAAAKHRAIDTLPKGVSVTHPVSRGRWRAVQRSLGMAVVLMLSVGATLAHAEPTLYVGMNGGTLQKNYERFVFPAFEKENNVKIAVVPGTSADIVAKMQAQKAHPTMHLAFLDDGVMVRAVGLGLCAPVTDKQITADLIPAARFPNDAAVAVQFGVVGLGYNKKLFDANHWAAPDSWAAFADPKYKGKVIFPSISSSTYGLYGFLMYNRLLGGNDSNVAPVFAKWSTTIGPNVLEYISNSAQISEMAQNGEAALFPMTATQIRSFKDQGIPVEYATPKEGAVKLMYSACMLANNDQPALAQKLIAYLISPPAQQAIMANVKSLPVNRTVKVSPELEQQLGKVDALEHNLQSVDWATINTHRAEWNARWNQQVER
ncbi:ABC transporter substrate-binding protein [Robbsia sp. KACC 23696]|uniref:ABC transporter substrate-binding protein n=1 Tax=Robbsia sp. KACC 23696 TaxID=3149231 RepID=UPI00325B90E7